VLQNLRVVDRVAGAYFRDVSDDDDEPFFDENEPVEIPIDGVLDLHMFRPRDVKDITLEYLRECHERGITRVRIIHGKGIGNLRRTVHALLEKHPHVVSFTLGGGAFGGWGATIVQLRVKDKDAAVNDDLNDEE
jgi:DNA-nicking Smr family endonuclease